MKRVFCYMLFLFVACMFFYSCNDKTRTVNEYGDLLKESSRIEILDRENNEVLKVITGKDKIYEVVDNLQLNKWEVIDLIPYDKFKRDNHHYKRRYCYEYIFVGEKYTTAVAVFKDKPVVRFKAAEARYNFKVPDEVIKYLRYFNNL